MAEVARLDAEAEADVTRMLREQGKCGEFGYPVYGDGRRWRTWCALAREHPGSHSGPSGGTEWSVTDG